MSVCDLTWSQLIRLVLPSLRFLFVFLKESKRECAKAERYDIKPSCLRPDNVTTKFHVKQTWFHRP